MLRNTITRNRRLIVYSLEYKIKPEIKYLVAQEWYTHFRVAL